jgi:hypothetical protein
LANSDLIVDAKRSCYGRNSYKEKMALPKQPHRDETSRWFLEERTGSPEGIR